MIRLQFTLLLQSLVAAVASRFSLFFFVFTFNFSETLPLPQTNNWNGWPFILQDWLTDPSARYLLKKKSQFTCVLSLLRTKCQSFEYPEFYYTRLLNGWQNKNQLVVETPLDPLSIFYYSKRIDVVQFYTYRFWINLERIWSKGNRLGISILFSQRTFFQSNSLYCKQVSFRSFWRLICSEMCLLSGLRNLELRQSWAQNRKPDQRYMKRVSILWSCVTVLSGFAAIYCWEKLNLCFANFSHRRHS